MDVSMRTEDDTAERTAISEDAVGCGITVEETMELQQLIRGAQPLERYKTGPHSRRNFIYEIVEWDGWRARLRKTADQWIGNNANIERAKTQVKREVVDSERPLLRGFCAFRLKEWSEHPPCPPPWLGIDDHEPQTVVFIALEDFGSENGFFMDLKQGSDVCLDGRSVIQFPRTGGGLGVFIALNI